MRRLRWTLTLAAQAGTRGLLGLSSQLQQHHDHPTAAAGDADDGLTPSQRIALMVCSVGLVVTAGLMSGLTLGLMSMDLVELEVLKRSGTPRERTYASAITPIVSNQHFLLVTLLLCNAAAMEALPLFLDRLADPVSAILISVTAVLVFGEILPQAVCSRYGLAIGYYCSWLVRLLMAATSPVSWPIGKLLDVLLGAEHRALFRRGQLKALVDIHGADEGLGGNLSEDEIKVICGALDLTSKTARKSMTPLPKVFMLPADARLNQQTMRAILASGHSRIPVYTPGNRSSIIGLILVKELLQYKTHQEVPVSEVRMRSLPRLPADTPMYDMLKLFQTGRSHMVVLTDTPASARAAAAAAAQAHAAAKAAADTARDGEGSEHGSDSGSSGSGSSPLASILRRSSSSKKKKKREFQSPLLQPLEIPEPLSTDEQQAAAGAGSGGLAAAECVDPAQQLLLQEQQQRIAAQAAWLEQPVPLPFDAEGGTPSLPPALRSSNDGSRSARGRVHFREHGGHSTIDAADAQQQQQATEVTSSSSSVDRQQQQAAGASQPDGQDVQQQQLGPVIMRRSSSTRSHSGGDGQSGASAPHTDVTNGPEGVAVPIGIITIEDVIEELIQTEVIDETDLFIDNDRSITVNAAALAQGLPAQLRLALQSPAATSAVAAAAAVGGLSGGALTGGGGAAGAVRKVFISGRQKGLGTGGAGSAGSTPVVIGLLPPPALTSYSDSGGVAAAVSSGLAAAAAAVGAGGRRGSGGVPGAPERQPLLSAADRAAPATGGS